MQQPIICMHHSILLPNYEAKGTKPKSKKKEEANHHSPLQRERERDQLFLNSEKKYNFEGIK